MMNGRSFFTILLGLLCLNSILVSCGSAVPFSAVAQAGVAIRLSTASTWAAAGSDTAFNTTALTLAAVCNGTSFPNGTVSSGDTVPLVTGSNCTVSLVSFTVPSSQEVFTSSAPASVGSSAAAGSYVGSQGNTATITPALAAGSLSPVSTDAAVLFVYASSNTVVASMESGYSYLGVVNGQTGTFQVTLRTSTGVASNLSLTTTGLPATWSATPGSCTQLTTASSCVVTLSFAPVSVDATVQTLTIPYSYTKLDGSSQTSRISLTYQGLNRLKWSYTTGGQLNSSPVPTADGTTVYATSYDNKIYAFNASTGAVRWSFTAGGAGIQGTAVLSSDGSVLYVGAVNGVTYAVNTSNGTQKWASANCGGAIYGDTALSPGGDIVYIQCYNPQKIFAFNTSTGATLWSTAAQAGNAGVAKPAPSADGTYVYTGGGTANTGIRYAVSNQAAVTYTFSQTTNSSGKITSDGSSIYFMGNNSPSTLFALNIPAMTLKWSSASVVAAGGSVQPLFNADNSIVYYVRGDGYLYAYSTSQTAGATGVNYLWRSASSIGGTIVGPLSFSIDGTKIYAGGATSLYEFSTAGAINWSYAVGSWVSGPVNSADGATIYAGTGNSKVYALNASVIKN